MVVDDATVVLENIYRHVKEHGSGREFSATSGTSVKLFSQSWLPPSVLLHPYLHSNYQPSWKPC
jgi:hypothetical protein